MVAYPFYPSGPNVDAESGTSAFRLSGHQVLLDRFRGGGFARIGLAMFDYEPWLTAFVILGTILWVLESRREGLVQWFRRHGAVLILAGFFIPYSLVLGIYELTQERFLLPLMPILVCIAVQGASVAASRLSVRWGQLGLCTAIVNSLLLVPQCVLAVRVARAWRSPSTLDLTAQWFRDYVPAGSARSAIIFQLDLPLLRTASALNETRRLRLDPTRPWLVYQGQLPTNVLAEERYDLVTVPTGARDLEGFEANLPETISNWNADYIIVQARTVSSGFQIDAMRDYLKQSATCVARFSPYRDEELDRPFWYQHTPEGYGWWTGHLLSAVRTGPVVEVYSMRK
jgi:hypothetical protein